MSSHHEEGAEIHAPQQVVLHLGDLEEDAEQLSLLLQTGEKQRGGALRNGEAPVGREGAGVRTHRCGIFVALMDLGYMSRKYRKFRTNKFDT